MTEPQQLDCIEVNPDGEALATVIWLHGLGADGHDFEPIIPHLNLPDDLKIRFIFPHAPKMPVTINGGFVMRAWYDILERSIDRKVDIQGVQKSCELIVGLIQQEIARGIDPEKIILAGFSQGGVIALETGLRYQPPLASIIALSTYVADQSNIPKGMMPIFFGHGTMDEVVPLTLGEQARIALESQGHIVDWHLYPIQHSVSQEEIVDIGLWIVERLIPV